MASRLNGIIYLTVFATLCLTSRNYLNQFEDLNDFFIWYLSITSSILTTFIFSEIKNEIEKKIPYDLKIKIRNLLKVKSDPEIETLLDDLHNYYGLLIDDSTKDETLIMGELVLRNKIYELESPLARQQRQRQREIFDDIQAGKQNGGVSFSFTTDYDLTGELSSIEPQAGQVATAHEVIENDNLEASISAFDQNVQPK